MPQIRIFRIFRTIDQQQHAPVVWMFTASQVRRLELQLAEAQEAQAEAEQVSARRLQKNKRLEARLVDSERACAETERRVAALETDLRAAPSAER